MSMNLASAYWSPPPGISAPVMLDGYGNPMGLPILAALAPIAKAVLPSLLPAVGGLFRGGGGGGAARPTMPVAAAAAALPGRLPSLIAPFFRRRRRRARPMSPVTPPGPPPPAPPTPAEVAGYGEEPYGYYGEEPYGHYAEDPYGACAEAEPFGYYGEEPYAGYAEVPAFDGFGNPLGLFPVFSLLKNIIGKRAAPAGGACPPCPPCATPAAPGTPAPGAPQLIYRRSRRRRGRLGEDLSSLAEGDSMFAEDPTYGYYAEYPGQYAGYGEWPFQQYRPPTAMAWPAQAAYRSMQYRSTPWPTNWVRSNLPYTGYGTQRMYMRCAVWPGPAGLVPNQAAQQYPGAPGQPALPGMPAPGMPGAPGMPMPWGGRRRRRRRR